MTCWKRAKLEEMETLIRRVFPECVVDLVAEWEDCGCVTLRARWVNNRLGGYCTITHGADPEKVNVADTADFLIDALWQHAEGGNC